MFSLVLILRQSVENHSKNSTDLYSAIAMLSPQRIKSFVLHVLTHSQIFHCEARRAKCFVFMRNDSRVVNVYYDVYYDVYEIYENCDIL